MRRIALGLALCVLAGPAYAGLVDDIGKEIFEDGSTKIKSEYRRCNSDTDCACALSLCRWRAVNSASRHHVEEESARASLECKWPKPPATAPIARCIDNLCDIPSDGKYY